jgi:gamma-glutamyl-gamma-aminobutyrate hydrolase PuuD
MSQRRPVIGIPADRRMIGPHPFHAVGEKYIDAVVHAADAIPFLIPVLEPALDVDELLARVDGILFTGSPSNVEPHRYNGPASEPGTWHDPHRDATTLPLIPRAVNTGVPVFGVCRGFQEMNVAYGGTLHQKVQDEPGFLDHREDKNQSLDVQYAPVHEFVAFARRARFGSRSRGRCARAGWADRSVPCERRAEIRARRAVAPRVASDEQFFFAGVVCGLRPRCAREGRK